MTSWFDSARTADLYLSVLVVGEIRRGVERLARRDADRAAAYEKWLIDLQETYGDRVVPVTAEIADVGGRIGAPDPLLEVEGLTLVTRNTADVARTGVRLLNPFDDS